MAQSSSVNGSDLQNPCTKKMVCLPLDIKVTYEIIGCCITQKCYITNKGTEDKSATGSLHYDNYGKSSESEYSVIVIFTPKGVYREYCGSGMPRIQPM